jgi:hypothetical protein
MLKKEFGGGCIQQNPILTSAFRCLSLLCRQRQLCVRVQAAEHGGRSDIPAEQSPAHSTTARGHAHQAVWTRTVPAMADRRHDPRAGLSSAAVGNEW